MTEIEQKLIKSIEVISKGTMAQIQALLVLITGIMVSEGIPAEKVHELYKEALINAQKEFGLEPIKEKQDESNR